MSKTCPKCDSNNIKTEYSSGEGVGSLIGGKLVGHPIREESLKITCKNCGFSGNINTSDTKSKKIDGFLKVKKQSETVRN